MGYLSFELGWPDCLAQLLCGSVDSDLCHAFVEAAVFMKSK